MAVSVLLALWPFGVAQGLTVALGICAWEARRRHRRGLALAFLLLLAVGLGVCMALPAILKTI